VPGGEKERNLQVDRLPVALVERIEIIRNSTPEMGDEGIGGIINIVLKQVPAKRTSGFTLGLGQQDGNTAGQLSGYLGDRTGALSWLLAGSYSERPEGKTKTKDVQEFHATAAPVAPGTGVTRRTKWEKEAEDERVKARELSLTPRLTWDIGDGHRLSLSPHLIQSEETKTKTKTKEAIALSGTRGMPTGAVTTTRENESEDKERTLTRLKGEWKKKLAGRGELSAFISAQRGDEEKSKIKREFNASNVLTKTTDEREQKDDADNSLGVKAPRSLGDHLVTLGLDAGKKERSNDKRTLETNNLTNVTTVKAPGRGDKFDIEETRVNLWVQDEWQITPTFALTPGVRFKQQKTRSVDGLGLAKEGTIRTTSPSLHGLWKVHPSLNLRASVAQSLRAPKFDDLSSITQTASGTNSATNPDKSGNPELRPEKALGTEIALEYFLPARAGVAGLNFFNRDVKDLVQKQTRLEGARFVERPYNVGDARIWGAELDVKGAWT
jgi:outer membrane receptor for ferrienterochelin and colicins